MPAWPGRRSSGCRRRAPCTAECTPGRRGPPTASECWVLCTITTGYAYGESTGEASGKRHSRREPPASPTARTTAKAGSSERLRTAAGPEAQRWTVDPSESQGSGTAAGGTKGEVLSDFASSGYYGSPAATGLPAATTTEPGLDTSPGGKRAGHCPSGGNVLAARLGGSTGEGSPSTATGAGPRTPTLTATGSRAGGTREGTARRGWEA